jgi:hypothetical protein
MSLRFVSFYRVSLPSSVCVYYLYTREVLTSVSLRVQFIDWVLCYMFCNSLVSLLFTLLLIHEHVTVTVFSSAVVGNIYG